MDAHELRDLLGAIEKARDRAEAAIDLVRPGIRPVELRHTLTEARAHLRAIRAILEAALEAQASGLHEEGAMHRRKLLQAMPLLAVSPAALERLAGTMAVDEGLVAAYREVLTEASRAYTTADPGKLYQSMRPVLDGVMNRLGAQRIAAEMNLIAGWLSLVVGERARANGHFVLAERISEQSTSHGSYALALEGRSILVSSVYYGGSAASPVALAALEQAVASFDDDTPAVVRQYVLSRLAQEQIAFGDNRFMGVLEAASEAVQPWQEPDGLYVGNGFWAHGSALGDVEAVACSARGQTSRAEGILNAQISHTPMTSFRRHSTLLAHLAGVHAGQQEPEQAARVAMRALGLASRAGSRLTVERVRSVRQRMHLWSGTPAVRELDEILRNLV